MFKRLCPYLSHVLHNFCREIKKEVTGQNTDWKEKTNMETAFPKQEGGQGMQCSEF